MQNKPNDLFQAVTSNGTCFFHYLFFIIKQFMNKIVILNDSVQLYEHYISDDRWEKTLAFPRGGLTYLISNGTIKFYAYEDYLYRNTLMSMQLPVHVIDDYAGIDDDLSDMDELTEALDRLFPTNDIDAELDNYLTKDEALETYQLKGDYVTTEELADVIDDYYTKDETDDLLDTKLDASAYTPTDLSDYYTKGETDDLLDGKQDVSAMTQYYTKGEANEAISAAISGKADTSAVTAVSDALTAHTSDSGIHVSQQEKEAWNAKLDATAYTPTDLSDYAKKEDIPSLDGYATQQWVENKNYLTEHQHLKTINGESLVGDGNIVISGGGGDMSNYYTKQETNGLLDNKLDASAYTPTDLSNYYNKGEVDTALGTKQDTLVSGTNIKTVNNQSLLGSGNIEIQGGVSSGDVQTIVNQSISSITSDVTNIQNQVTNLSIALNQCCSGSPTPTPTPIYRTYSGSPYCDGYDKYVETVYQVSYDSGSTWQNISSPEQVLVEHNSLDCGYVDGTKITLTNEAGDTKTVDCDGKPLIKSETVMRSALCIPKTAVIGDCVTEIAEGAFEGDDCVVDISMPDSVSTIGNYAFGSCHNLSAITLSTGLTSIGISLFENCGELTSMPALPAAINTIPSGMFRKSGLQGSLVIPSTIREIGSTAFWNCTGLTSVYMDSVTIINDLAFSGCTSLQSITINQTLPPAVGNNTKCFDDTNNCPIYVPANRVDLYKQTSGLSKYADRIQAIQ